jgi:hypothetical protein
MRFCEYSVDGISILQKMTPSLLSMIKRESANPRSPRNDGASGGISLRIKRHQTSRSNKSYRKERIALNPVFAILQGDTNPPPLSPWHTLLSLGNIL